MELKWELSQSRSFLVGHRDQQCGKAHVYRNQIRVERSISQISLHRTHVMYTICTGK
jgi:hypothetical protein